MERNFMRTLADRMIFLVVVGFALIVICQTPKSVKAAPPAPSRHDECLSVKSGYLPEMTLLNVCDAPIDLKWCHMTKAGTNIGCRVERPLAPKHFVSTGACAGCQWKVNFEVFLSSDRADGSFSSDADMLENLRNH